MFYTEINSYTTELELSVNQHILESKILSKSKRIVKYYGCYKTQDYAIFITKFYQYGTILDQLQRKGNLDTR